MLKLNNEMLEILRECLRSNRPDLLWVLDDEKTIEVDEELGNDLRNVINDEFVKVGLNDNDEPNELGIKLEDLIDKIGRSYL
ncbi:hypothetical protein CLPU_9c00730 [Gottschalkia purinilytica]|uniref:Uncharacterized protein n=1 Tax=Gottschalkia purinilytica TaxID=1503 RepID=A0A0L0W9Q2_GOTPU|nr:hypothetical protein [Gottschalkia purinilytica]KNF08177.1 hypothetical protein CLPU_9c00730 [Gottschalkia purinilytica]